MSNKSDWRLLLKQHIEAPPHQLPYSIKYSYIERTIRKQDIMQFVSELHDMQHSMLEEVLEMQAQAGFPEANKIIAHVMGLK